jgi:hypothetical protein
MLGYDNFTFCSCHLCQLRAFCQKLTQRIANAE